MERHRRRASPEALLSALASLGAPVRTMADVPIALRERDLEIWRRLVEPVIVAREDEDTEVELHFPEVRGRVEADVETEDGKVVGARVEPSSVTVEVHGHRFERRVGRIGPLPLGYHRLRCAASAAVAESTVVCAPPRCAAVTGKRWGAFMPLHAVRSGRNWGCGDLTDLAELSSWIEELGGAMVGTLPLLAAYLDRPFEPSPYSPVSRLFWNEVFIDVERIPELERSASARRLLASSGFRREVQRLRRTRLVDYRGVAALKRRALRHLARTLQGGADDRRDEFERFSRTRPHLDDYARFRAFVERRGTGWTDWPPRERAGRIASRDVDPDVVAYHRYVQWVAEDQLAASASHRAPGEGLYLDLPLGVNPDGYDTWRFRHAFAHGARGGAPPDMFFTKGQNWGFPPLHPEGLRADGYGYFRSALQTLLRHSGTLRIDHVMGLHRLYWIPPGMDATSGVYVGYRPDELYAVLALESHRAGSAIVGEDLGTVPPYVRPAMARHGVLRSYVLQLEALIRDRMRAPASASLASLNTHDMPTFAAFWGGTDVDDREAQGLIDPRTAWAERGARAHLRKELVALFRTRGRVRGRDTAAVMRSALAYLATGPSRLMVAGLEDLWLEREPQNRPGTGPEQPNWRRKAGRTLEAVRMDRHIAGTLEEIDRLRRGRGPRGVT